MVRITWVSHSYSNHSIVYFFVNSLLLQKIKEISEIPFESTTRGIGKEKFKVTALTGVENHDFPAICMWIEKFFSDKSEVNLATVGAKNILYSYYIHSKLAFLFCFHAYHFLQLHTEL